MRRSRLSICLLAPFFALSLRARTRSQQQQQQLDSFIAEKVPSVFLALGQGQEDWSLVADDGSEFGPLDTRVTVHNRRFVLNEGVLQRGVALHAHLALQRLSTLNA